MIFAHADETAVDGKHPIRIAQFFVGRDSLWFRSCPLLVQSLVGEVGKGYNAVADNVRSASVFMNARTYIKGCRRHVFVVRLLISPDDNIATVFSRTAFTPIEVRSVYYDLSQPNRAGYY